VLLLSVCLCPPRFIFFFQFEMWRVAAAFGLLSSFIFISSSLADNFDPRSRDFTAACRKTAEIAPAAFCKLFDNCCSPDNKLDPLNGDRCQQPDPANGCRMDNDRISFAQCKASNCTVAMTTTTARPSHLFKGTVITNLGVGVLLMSLVMITGSRQVLI